MLAVIIIDRISSDIHKSGLFSRQFLYLSSGLRAVGVLTNNRRGQSLGPCHLCGGLDKARQVVPITLLVRIQRNSLYMAVEGPSTRYIVFSMIPGSYYPGRRRFTIFVPEAKFSSFTGKFYREQS